MKLKYFKHIWLPTLLWYITGRFLWERFYNWYWVAYKKRPAIWRDADPDDEQTHNSFHNRKYCRTCGRNYKNNFKK